MMMVSSILMITQRWRQSHDHYDFPSHQDEPWVKMEHGGFVFFKEGDKIAEVVGVAKEWEDDGH